MTKELLNKPVTSIKRLSLDVQGCPYIGLVSYKDGSKIVIKEMTPENKREIAILNRIGKHENIVEKLGEFDPKEICTLTEKIKGKFGQDAIKGIFFEYVDGGNLAGLSDAEKRKYSTPIIYDISSALQHSHSKKIVHADIKPLNIVITKNGHYKGARLIDFDCAIYLGKRISANERKNTEYYRSPEQVYDGVVRPRSDIFSLGLIFYDMLTGGNLSFAQKYLGDEKEKPSKDRRLNALIDSMLEREARNRPFAREVKSELGPYTKAYK